MEENNEKYCLSCGTIINKEAEFCPKCGKKQIQNNSVEKKGLSMASFIIGIFSIIIPIIGFIGGIISLVFGVKGVKRSMKGVAVAGIVFGILAIIGNIILIIYVAFEYPKASRVIITNEIQKSIVEKYSETNDEIEVVKDLVLVHKSGNDYIGTITLSSKGITEKLSVDIIYDGKAFSWKIERSGRLR